MKITEKIKSKVRNYDCDSPVKIAFLGDSVTHGCFETDEKQEGRSECDYDYDAVYHNRLKKLFAAAFPTCPITMINAGISGGDAKRGLERLERDIISVNPDLAVVCFALNDVHKRKAGLQIYIDSLKGIFEKLKENGIEIIFLTPNMMCTYVAPQVPALLRKTAENCVELQNTGVLDLYVDSAKELCEEMQIPVCDCYKIWKNFEKCGADIPWILANHINHPIRELHSVFAYELFRTIMLDS